MISFASYNRPFVVGFVIVCSCAALIFVRNAPHGAPGLNEAIDVPPVSPHSITAAYYYYDIEPREQKFLRFGMDYHTMLRGYHRTATRAVPPPAQLLVDDTASSSSSASQPKAVTHSLGQHLPVALHLGVAATVQPIVSSMELVTERNAAQLRERLNDMKTSKLRRFLKERIAAEDGGDGCEGCVEKRHLIERILEVRGWLSPEDISAHSLAALQDSITSHPLPFHLGMPMTAQDTSQIVAAQKHAAELEYYFECNEGPQRNGTVTCNRRRQTAAVA